MWNGEMAMVMGILKERHGGGGRGGGSGLKVTDGNVWDRNKIRRRHNSEIMIQ